MAKEHLHVVEPSETHVLKAVAWDSMYAAYKFSVEAAPDKKGQDAAKKMLATMDKILENTAATLSSSKTWRGKMPRQIEDEFLYACRACGHASAKTDWEPYRIKDDNRPMMICPHCGTWQDVSIANKVVEPAPKPKETKPDEGQPKKETGKSGSAPKK
jgi:hypothetical protein